MKSTAREAESFSSMKILAVDDDRGNCQELATLLAGWGFDVETAFDGREALDQIATFAPHLMITDLVIPRLDGFELLTTLATEGRQIPTIVLTAFGNIEVALQVIHQLGAFWFLEKPIHAEALHVLIDRAAKQVRLAEQEERLRRQLAYRGMLVDLIGDSPPMQEVYSLIQQIAPSKVPVLITGESGTGKELAARAIHALSPRSRGPFVAVNCAALPEELIESELFGHEKGAFTGALERRSGCFERANGGTLLLDELAEMPVHLQAKLLRVIEESKVRPLGGGGEIPVDVRVIASTNRPLDQAIHSGEFREDLYYRLSVFLVAMPPLRERRSDIPLLVEAMIAVSNQRHGCHVAGTDDRVMQRLQEHRWPGNVRELRNVIERAVILANTGTLRLAHLPPGLGPAAERPAEPSDGEPCVRLPVGTTLAQLEKALIGLTLASTANDKTRAARILGISRKTMFNRLREYRALDAAGLGRASA